MKNALLKNSMNFGALCGIVIIIISLLLYLLGANSNWLNSIIIFTIFIVILFVGTKYYRDHYANGMISYGRSVGSGVLISLFMSILVAFYIYMFFKLIAPDELNKIFEQQEEELYNRGMSEEKIDMAIQMVKKFTTPLTMAVGTILSYTLWGTVFSLIIAIFVKKSGESYQQIMQEIENDINKENE
ncbi:MAG: DUF4199 domain-containing protein [Bacteroidales bacterium]|nr:DUF4199 domain-containing protein [Bacteroidales bacterium]